MLDLAAGASDTTFDASTDARWTPPSTLTLAPPTLTPPYRRRSPPILTCGLMSLVSAPLKGREKREKQENREKCEFR
jgi:hypothetical protein